MKAVWLTLALSACAVPAEPARDAFGIVQFCPTVEGGQVWESNWHAGQARTFDNQDPGDRWFDCDHGDATYAVDGRGTLTATGNTVRMYVHDPDCRREWSDNLEITVYVTRVSETRPVSYGGLQIFARTNHGTVGREDDHPCDTRGLGAKVCTDGRWEFEKETCHHAADGYASAGWSKPWDALPVGRPIGVKYLLRNQAGGTQVKVELYRDLTDGQGGGDWQKMTEFVDDGTNWGVGKTPAKVGLQPELPLLHDLMKVDSESGLPCITVYFRHEYGTMRYQRASIREIAPLP